MKLRHESARTLIYKAGALADRGEPVGMAAALAKLATAESSVESSLDALRIHGAEGYTKLLGIEAALRDAVGGLSYSGTADIVRTVVARQLGVGAGGRQRPSGDRRSGSEA